MHKKTVPLLAAALAVLLAGAFGHRAASEPSGPVYKSRELIMLEQAKSELEDEGKEVPEELLRKIEWETEYSRLMAPEMKKRELEIRQIEAMRAKTPKDEKGNPILPEPEFPEYQPEPYKEAGQVGDREYAESFFPGRSRTNTSWCPPLPPPATCWCPASTETTRTAVSSSASTTLRNATSWAGSSSISRALAPSGSSS